MHGYTDDVVLLTTSNILSATASKVAQVQPGAILSMPGVDDMACRKAQNDSRLRTLAGAYVCASRAY